jgi:2'-5' RNA ligase
LAFQRINLGIADDGVFYDEENNREAIVELDDSQADLEHLTKLKQTGLASSYFIWAAKDLHDHVTLSVMFAVDPGLDNAILS